MINKGGLISKKGISKYLHRTIPVQDRVREFTHWVYENGNIVSHAAG